MVLVQRPHFENPEVESPRTSQRALGGKPLLWPVAFSPGLMPDPEEKSISRLSMSSSVASPG